MSYADIDIKEWEKEQNKSKEKIADTESSSNRKNKVTFCRSDEESEFKAELQQKHHLRLFKLFLE